jgi:hypothetical protein
MKNFGTGAKYDNDWYISWHWVITNFAYIKVRTFAIHQQFTHNFIVKYIYSVDLFVHCEYREFVVTQRNTATRKRHVYYRAFYLWRKIHEVLSAVCVAVQRSVYRCTHDTQLANVQCSVCRCTVQCVSLYPRHTTNKCTVQCVSLYSVAWHYVPSNTLEKPAYHINRTLYHML